MRSCGTPAPGGIMAGVIGAWRSGEWVGSPDCWARCMMRVHAPWVVQVYFCCNFREFGRTGEWWTRYDWFGGSCRSDLAGNHRAKRWEKSTFIYRGRAVRIIYILRQISQGYVDAKLELLSCLNIDVSAQDTRNFQDGISIPIDSIVYQGMNQII